MGALGIRWVTPPSHLDPEDDLGEAVDETLPKSQDGFHSATIRMAGGTARERVKFNLS